MTPAQIALDILQTIPDPPPGSATQPVSTTTLAALRSSIVDAVDEERCVHGLLYRLRPLAESNFTRMQGEANTNPNSVTEHWLEQAREILHSVNARTGGSDD